MVNEDRELSKYTPAYEPVSLREPTEAERRLDASLDSYMKDEIKLECDEEMMRRDTVLAEVKSIFTDWVKFVAVKVLHMPEDAAEEAGGELFISGSHRLGVRDIGADIDTVCVAPNFCTREHFFTFLKEDFEKRVEVTDLNAVEGAFVPLISFDFRGVSIDLLFARLADNVVPRDLDILDDGILVGLDEATEKSLNGPRVTNMIFKLVGEKTFPNFLIVLRCVRKWAKRRGVYGNKLGYLGGVNCNILVAFICQLFPNSGPSSLLFRFFKHYRDWKWPEAIMLNNIQQHAPGQLGQPVAEERAVWLPKQNMKDLMPIITPAYPAMNSAHNVSQHTFEVLQDEIRRGYQLLEGILKEKIWHKRSWDVLFEPSDFFLKYPHYLACHIVGTGDNAESRSWIGFVESRIRRLTQFPYLEKLPIRAPIHLHPVVSKTSKSTNSICYFIGFSLDLQAIRGSGDSNVHIDECVFHFQESLWDSERGYSGERVDGLDFFAEHLPWKKLPKEIFEPFGGYDTAKRLRKERGYRQISERLPASDTSRLSAKSAQKKGEDQLEGSAAMTVKEAVVGASSASALDEIHSVRLASLDSSASLLPTVDNLKRKIMEAASNVIEDTMGRKVKWQRLAATVPQMASRDAQRRSFSIPHLSWNLSDK